MYELEQWLNAYIVCWDKWYIRSYKKECYVGYIFRIKKTIISADQHYFHLRIFLANHIVSQVERFSEQIGKPSAFSLTQPQAGRYRNEYGGILAPERGKGATGRRKRCQEGRRKEQMYISDFGWRRSNGLSLRPCSSAHLFFPHFFFFHLPFLRMIPPLSIPRPSIPTFTFLRRGSEPSRRVRRLRYALRQWHKANSQREYD